MKFIFIFLASLFGVSFAQASDSAKCTVLLNGVEVAQKEVFHQDYDVQIDGLYTYRTYAQDEFYNLFFKFKTNSNPTKIQLDVALIGDAHNFHSSISSSSNLSETKAEIIDHEGSIIEVICGIL